MKSARFRIPMLPVLSGLLAYVCATAAAEPPMYDAASTGSLEIRTPQGRYVGAVFDGTRRQFADVLLTEEGEIRMHIGGSDTAESGVIPDRWGRSAQFVGRLSVRDGVIRGSGRMLGENCALPNPVRFCRAPAWATLRFRVAGGDRLTASMRVTTDGGVEVWQVVLDAWDDYYRYPVSLRGLQGLYAERTAEFSRYGTTIIRVDATGRMFFESAATGCVGNGTLAPRNTVGVVDVRLRIENCQGQFGYLNGRYLGFSTFSLAGAWDYGAVLRTWLAKPAGSARPAALTMWSIPR